MASHRNVTFNKQFGFRTNQNITGVIPHSATAAATGIPVQYTPSFYEPVQAQQAQQVITTSQQQGQTMSPQPQLQPQFLQMQQQQMTSTTIQTGQVQVLQTSMSQQQSTQLLQQAPLPQRQHQQLAPPQRQQQQIAPPQKKEKVAKPQKKEKATKPQKKEKAAKPQKEEKATKPQKKEKVAKPQKEEKAAKPQKKEKAAKPQKEEKTAKPQKKEKAAKPQKEGKAAKPQKKENDTQSTENNTVNDESDYVPLIGAAASPLTDTTTAPPDSALPAGTGQVTREVTKQEQQMFSNILKNLDHLTRPTKGQLSSPDDPSDFYTVKKSPVETIFDISFQPVGIFNLSDENGPVQQVDHFSGPLAVGQRVGLDIFSGIFQNALGKWIRNIAILIEFIFIAIDLSLDIASLATGNNSAYVVIHLILILIGLLLALGDGFVHVVSEYCPCSCTGNCCNWCHALKNKVDATRIVLPNILLVPILICDLFDILVGGFEDASGIIGLILFIIDILYSFVFLKILNIIIAVKILLGLRSVELFTDNTDDRLKKELKLHRRRLFIYCCFLFHSFLQTVGDFFMLVTLGVQIRYENYNPNLQTGVRVSLDLGVMCFIVCILPFFQLLFFILTYHYWFQESLVSLVVDFVGLNSKVEVFDSEKEQETFKEIFEKRVRVDEVRDQLEKSIKEKPFWTKISHPFANLITFIYIVNPLALCYLIFFALAGKGFLAAENIGVIDSATTAATIFSCFLNVAVNFYLFLGSLAGFVYQLFVISILIWACFKLLVCQYDKILKQF